MADKHSINSYKWHAGNIADTARRGGHEEAARIIVARRVSYGARAALLSGLVIGALVESGHADVAEKVLESLARVIR